MVQSGVLAGGKSDGGGDLPLSQPVELMFLGIGIENIAVNYADQAILISIA